MRKNIIIQGMGYVGFANGIACAMAKKIISIFIMLLD